RGLAGWGLSVQLLQLAAQPLGRSGREAARQNSGEERAGQLAIARNELAGIGPRSFSAAPAQRLRRELEQLDAEAPPSEPPEPEAAPDPAAGEGPAAEPQVPAQLPAPSAPPPPPPPPLAAPPPAAPAAPVDAAP
ncbi:MAG: hypothetical protein ACKOPS_16620, partial [Cyanobium sp.]